MTKLITNAKIYRDVLKLWLLIGLAVNAQGQDYTNNGGTITAQYTNANSAENYSKLIDNDPATKYYINYPAVWVQYQSSSAVVVTQYTVTSANDSPTRDPKDWTLQASNDGSSWISLDTQAGQIFASRFLTKIYSFTNSTAYSYFRLSITANSGSTATQFAELELLGDDGSIDLTNNGGTISAQYNNTNAAENYPKVIDNSSTTKYYIAQTSLWIQYQSTAPSVLTRYTITSANDNSSRDPKSWTLQGSNNGSTWTTIDAQSNQTFASRYLLKTYWLTTNTSSYIYYRLSITLNNGATATQLAEWELWGNTPPASPGNLTAFATSASQINLTWSDNSNNETGFDIERSTDGTNFSAITSVGANTSSYSNTGLSQLTTYYYRVKAVNTAASSGYSNVANATTPDILPVAPTGLTAAAASSTQINLSWSDNSNNETGFQIERSADGSTFSSIATVNADITTYSNTGLSPLTTYYYKVRAVGTAGSSAYTNVASTATPDNIPAAPTVLTATATSSSQINLAWIDNSTNETGFEVERSTNGTTFTLQTTTNANVTTLSVTGLTASTTYYFRVRSVGTAGPSGYSNTANATTQSSGTIVAPDNLTATPISATQVTLLWNDNSNNETGFRIEQSTDNITFTLAVTTAVNVRAQSLNGLIASTLYYFRIYAINATGSSSYSNVATATTYATTGTAPTAPSGLTVTAASSNQINVSWTDNSTNETKFRLERSVNGSTWTLLTNVGAGVTSYSNLVPASSTFYYRLRAENLYGNSAYTSGVSATTPAGGTQVDITDALGGIISATYTQGTQSGAANEAIDKFIDNSFTTKFFVSQQTNTITYTCPRTYIANRYMITSGSDYMERDPKNWRFEGSADGATWTILDTRTNQLFSTRNETKSFTFTNTTEHLFYRLVITLNNGSGDTQMMEWEIWGSPGAGTPPAAPSNFISTGTSSSQINLSWTDNSNNEDAFIIEKSMDGSSYVIMTTTSANAISYVDNSVSSATTYLYKIRSKNSAGFSSYVGPLYASTSAAALPPDITDNAGGITSDQYNVSGNEGNTKLTDNSIYTKYYTANATTWIRFQAPVSATVTGYAITSGNDAPERDPFNWVFQGSNDGTAWTNLNTQSNQKFINRQQTKIFTFSNTTSYVYFRLNITQNNGGASTQVSEFQIFGTGGGSPNTAVPSVPTGLTATVASGDQIILTWTDNAVNEAGYRLEWSTNGGSTWNPVSLPANSTRYPHFGLTELMAYSYRLRAEASQGNSAYTATVNGTTLSSAYPNSWQEHWLEHIQLVSKVYSDQHVGIYFDPDVVPQVSWMNQVVSDAWQYTKNTYGSFSNVKLYAIFHQDKYGGGNPSSYFDATRDYRNAICVGKNGDWTSNTGWNLDATIHEIGHIVEGGSKGVHNSPAFPLWGDSKWMDIYQYDLYLKLGWTSETTRWYNASQTNVVAFPRANSYWFRDWWYPIYSQYGETAVLNNYFTLLSQYFLKFNGNYSRNLNWGEFIHFWSGAAGVDLKAQATFAFGWTDAYELQFRQAQIDFPFTYGSAMQGSSSARSATRPIQTPDEKPVLQGEGKITVWPNPASSVLNVLLSGGEQLKSIGITSVTGAKALELPATGRMMAVDVSELQPALYIIMVVSDKGKVFTEKVILHK